MQSVERTAVIELFSTFFDRLSSTHPQRDSMMKELFHFKGLLYCNDTSVIDNYLITLQSTIQAKLVKQTQVNNEEKSPIRDHKGNRDGSTQRIGNSQNKQNSLRKDFLQDKENANNVVRKLETTIYQNNTNQIRQSDDNLELIKQRLHQQSELSLRNLNSKTPTSRLIKNNIISNNSNILNVSQMRPDNEDQQSINNGMQSLTGTSRIAKINSKRNTVFTSCGHEIDRETFLQYANALIKEQNYVDCPVCSMQLPLTDYSHLVQNSFEDFKNKHLTILKSLKQIKKNDDAIIAILLQLESDETLTLNKQRQFSSGGDALRNIQKENNQNPCKINTLQKIFFKDQMNSNSRVNQQEPDQTNQRFKKCLRCSKSVEGGSSYFCQTCKNF